MWTFTIAHGADLRWEGNTRIMSRSTIINNGSMGILPNAGFIHRELNTSASIINNFLVFGQSGRVTTIEANLINNDEIFVSKGTVLDLTGGGASNRGSWFCSQS